MVGLDAGMDEAVARLTLGAFVRVKRDSGERSGHDGMVMAPPDANGEVGLLFHRDRYDEPVLNSRGQSAPCEGIESWNLSELDLSTAEQ